jgi:hypothetical protein
MKKDSKKMRNEMPNITKRGGSWLFFGMFPVKNPRAKRIVSRAYERNNFSLLVGVSRIDALN